MGVVLNLLRQQLIDYALDTNNLEMFQRLTSQGWEQFVIAGDSSGDRLSRFLVLHDSIDGPVTKVQLPNTELPTVFAIAIDELDNRGWRDVYGLTFYDRLKNKGTKRSHDWIAVSEHLWEVLKQECRIIHPKNFKISHPSKTTILPE